jgi:zinc transport system substrate-binding protein
MMVLALRTLQGAALGGLPAVAVAYFAEQIYAFLVRPLAALPEHARVVALMETEGLTLHAFREGGPWEAHEHEEGQARQAAHHDHGHARERKQDHGHGHAHGHG